MKNIEKANAARSRVLELLKDYKWHSTVEINLIGGTEGTRRLRELRELGYTIERKHVGAHNYQYKLSVGPTVGESG